MESFIDTNTNKYPCTLYEIKRDYPEYNVYQPLPDGVFAVKWVEPPEDIDIYHCWVAGNPVIIDGVWTTNWVLKERKLEPYQLGPGPWLFDEESQTWYLAHPLAKATYDK